MPSRQDRHHPRERKSLWKWIAGLVGLVLIALAVSIFTGQKGRSDQTAKEVKTAQSSSHLSKKSDSKNQSVSSSTGSASNGKTDTQSSDQIISGDLVGTWQGQTPVSNYAVTMTFQENGQIDVTIDQTALSFTVGSLKEISPGLYLYQDISPADQAHYLLPGAELGGTGGQVKFGYGVSVNGDTIKPVFWQVQPDQDFTADNMSKEAGYHGEFTLSRSQ